MINLWWFDIIYKILIGLGIFLLILFIFTRFKLKFFKRKTSELNLELEKKASDLKEANERLMVLNAIGEIGISTLEVDEVLNRLITVIVETTKLEGGRIFLYNTANNQLEVKASHGIKNDVSSHEFLYIKNFVSNVIKNNKIIVSYDYSKALLGIPLRSREIINGVIEVEAEKNYRFTSKEMKLMELVADRANLSIDRAESYRQIKRYADELSVITSVGNAITSTLEVEELCDFITKTAVEVTNAEVSTLRLIEDGDNEELVLKSIYGLNDSYIYKGSVKIGKSIVGRVVKDKIPIIVSNLQADSRYEYPELAQKSKLKSLISIPLAVKNDVIGALSIYTMEERVFNETDVKLLSVFANQAAVAIENARLFGSIKEMYFATVKAFAEALSARDTYTRGHSEQVAKYAKEIAIEMNLSDREVEIVEYGAILHDIGKIGIEDKILNKPESLSNEEYESIKRHPVIASKILEPLEWFSDLIPVITHHHEHFDGGGYPAGLSKEKIPLLARILLVVDSFEAMTSNRPYRKALSQEQAINELKKHSGTQFDPIVIESFLRVLNKKNGT